LKLQSKRDVTLWEHVDECRK